MRHFLGFPLIPRVFFLDVIRCPEADLNSLGQLAAFRRLKKFHNVASYFLFYRIYVSTMLKHSGIFRVREI